MSGLLVLLELKICSDMFSNMIYLSKIITEITQISITESSSKNEEDYRKLQELRIRLS